MQTYAEGISIVQFDLTQLANCDISWFDGGISAGFPSPATDYMEQGIDLHRELIKNPSSTFFCRVEGNSMEGDGICDGDIIIVDKSLPAKDGKLVVCFLDGGFVLKRLKITGKSVYLLPSNPRYPVLNVTDENDFRIWGIVTCVISKK
ncbi:MAG: translesion error-prone DNA polymerase V autoproteolytic subunit [Bacteroidetes bacterium]|nr:translesion error-prone DNA polymerase V autoproteolytic subunit [Bacteroidota bacterium]